MLSDAEKKYPIVEVPLNGGLVTAEDATVIGIPHFSVLKNLRPGRKNPKPMFGMTKINSVATAQTALRSGHHFRKASESHVLVEGGGVAYVASTSAIPNTDTFASLYTDPAGALTGRYADAPGEMLCRCTGKEALLWGGTEHRVGKFLDYPTTSKIYDYTEAVQNDLDDDNNLATIHAVNTPIDANTMLLLHCDGANGGTTFTDSSPTTAHAVTANGNANTSTAYKKFGTASGFLDGTGDYLSILDNADFDFSGGAFTIDTHYMFPTASLPSSGNTKIHPLYYQQTDANNYISLYLSIYNTGMSFPVQYTVTLVFKIVAASATVVTMSTLVGYHIQDAFHHYAIVENGNSFYMFYDGSLVNTVSDADRAANYTGAVWLGYDGTNYAYGYFDEFRVSDTYRWTSGFSVPSAAYGTGYSATMYVASIMPIKGLKFYVDTANTQTSTMVVSEWNGAWNDLTTTDNTSAGGISLAQTGTVTFASTATTAKQKAFFKSIAYWYKIVVTASADFNEVPKLKKVVVDIPMQPIRDLWDGTNRKCASFLANVSTVFKDYTTNIFEDSYTATGATADLSTYATLGALGTSDYLIAGFMERMMGLVVNIISGTGNVNASQIEVDYWDGDEWVALTVEDGTLEGTASFAKSGWITWNPPNAINEQKQTTFASHVDKTAVMAREGGLRDPSGERRAAIPNESIVGDRGALYYYRIKFNAALSATVNIYHVAGIPAPQDIRGYTFALQHQNRLVLCDNYDKSRNAIKTSAYGQPNVLNGDDSFDKPFGNNEPLVAGASLFTRVGSSVASLLVMCKAGETWTHIGALGGETDKNPVSDKIGCVAPRTMCTIPDAQAGTQLPGVPNNMAVWVSQRGVEQFDGYRFTLISKDIGDKFDPNNANYFGASAIAAATAVYDPVYHCYHLFIQGTSEWAYSFAEQKWFQPVRTPLLYGAFSTRDTNGTSYTYGFANNGFVYRLNNGATWAGTAITYDWRPGDIALYEGKIAIETQVAYVKHVCKVNNDVTTTITVTHYVDGDTVGKTIEPMAPQKTGRRITQIVRGVESDGIFHSTDFSLACDTGSAGYEPLFLAYYFDPKAIDKGFSVNDPRT